MLGRQLRTLLEILADARADERERLEHRHAIVLVEVGAVVPIGLEQELRKDGLERLRGRVVGGDHHVIACRQLLQERRAATRAVDEDQPPWYRLQQLAPLRRTEVGSDEVELRVAGVVAAAVPHQHHQHHIVLGGARAQVGDGRTHVLARRPLRAGEVLLGQHQHVGFGIAKRPLQQLDERRAPLVVLLGILRPARCAGHHQRVALAGARHTAGRQEQTALKHGEREAAARRGHCTHYPRGVRVRRKPDTTEMTPEVRLKPDTTRQTMAAIIGAPTGGAAPTLPPAAAAPA